MIQLLMFLKDYRTFKAKEIIPFLDGVNLLVGDQGCGKSTILQILCSLGGIKSAFWKRDTQVKNMKEIAFLAVSKPKQVFAHDYENDSPRTSPSMDTMGMLPFNAALTQMRMSHGQATNQLVSLIETCKDMFLILDEPDSGLSCRSALALVDAMKKAESQGCQVIASVHHPWVIEAFPRVYSVEHRKYMKSGEFLESLRSPASPTASMDPISDKKTDEG